MPIQITNAIEKFLFKYLQRIMHVINSYNHISIVDGTNCNTNVGNQATLICYIRDTTTAVEPERGDSGASSSSQAC